MFIGTRDIIVNNKPALKSGKVAKEKNKSFPSPPKLAEEVISKMSGTQTTVH